MAADSGFEGEPHEEEFVKVLAEFMRQMFKGDPKAVELAKEIYVHLGKESGMPLYHLWAGISPTPSNVDKLAEAAGVHLHDKIKEEDRRKIEAFFSGREKHPEGAGLSLPPSQPPRLGGGGDLPLPASTPPTLDAGRGGGKEGEKGNLPAFLEGMGEREKARVKALYGASPDEIARKLKAGRELSLAEREALKAIAEREGPSLHLPDDPQALSHLLQRYYALYEEGRAPWSVVEAVEEKLKAIQEGGEGQRASPRQGPTPLAGEQGPEGATLEPPQGEPSREGEAEPQAQRGQEEAMPPERLTRIMDTADDYAALLHAKEKVFKPFMRQRFKDALAREAEIVEALQGLLEEIGEGARANPRRAERELHLLFTSVRERYSEHAGGFLWRLRTKKATWARLAVGIALTTTSFFVGGPVLAAVAGGAVALRGLGLFATADAVGDVAHLWQASRAGIGGRVGAQLLYRRDVGIGEVLESFRSAETREAVRALAVELSTKPVQVAKDAMWVRIVKRAVGAVAAVASIVPFADKLFAHAPAGGPEPITSPTPSGTPPADATSVHAPAPPAYDPSDVFVSTVDRGDGVYHLSAEMVREAKEAYALGSFDEEAARVALQQAIINGADSGDVLYADATHVEAFSHILKMVDSEAAVRWHGLPKDVWITIDPSSTPGGDVVAVEGEMREKMEQFFSLLREASREGYVGRKEVLALAKKAGLQIGNFAKNPPAYLRA